MACHGEPLLYILLLSMFISGIRVHILLDVVCVSPIAVMQAASMAFMVSTAVTIQPISCIQTALALLRACSYFQKALSLLCRAA